MPLDQFLVVRQVELEQLNFQILQVEPKTLVASRRSFYWDCFFTFAHYTVFVRRVTTLSAQMIESDRPNLLAISKELNPPSLPRGFQSGNVVLVAYIADRVDGDAQLLCRSKIWLNFAQFYIPAALDLEFSKAFLIEKAPFWGFVYYGKFRYVLNRLLLPQGKPNREPISTSGIILLLVQIALMLIPFAALLLVIFR